MTGLPKAIIKKYGVTKKAWSVFRSRKTAAPSRTVRRSRKTSKRSFMARRKRSFGKRSSRSMSGKMQPVLDAAISGAIVGAALKVVPTQYNTMTTRLVAGGAASYMGSGYIKKAGELLIAIEAARLTSGLVSGGLTTTAGTNSVQLY